MQDRLVNETKNIVEVGIDSSIEESYLAYSMSVIIGRALPDARDGLKPVHRRILYAMHELGLTSKVAYKKSARIVGDVIGKYHPHGDNAVYDALVRMAQDFSMRLELVDGQGNFGSIDGDNAAAMRYTEARMTKASEEILRDIDKDTIDFVPNYDDTLKEPDILPSRLPNLLVNGANGIAVGMATSIPPHRIDEIIDALAHVLENPNAELDEILEFVKGPDFPTGGIIYGKAGIVEAYKTGRGRVKVRAKVHVEKTKNKEIIVLDEMPFQTNKAKLVEQISDLAREKQIEGISEVRDESDREGIRVVIELKRDAMSEIVLNHLYKLTTMETTFSIILLAIYNKEPKIFTLLELLRLFLNHRKTIIIRRTIFELEKAKARAHILEGYLIALDNIDEIVRLIKTSPSPEAAKNALMERFSLSEIQSKAILEMRLQRLTGLERDKIKEEYQNLLELIDDLNGILKSEDRLNEVVKTELLEVKEQFSSPRRTEIQESYESIDTEDLIANEPMVVSMSHKGYVKRVDLKAYEKQNRGGKGKLSGSTYEDDFIENFFVANTHDILLFITNKGQLYHLKVYKIPEASRIAMGKAIVNLISLAPDEKIMATLSTKDFSDERSLAFFTKNGVVKRTNLSEFESNRSCGIRAIVLDEGDELVSAKVVDKNAKHLLIASHLGIFIKFPLEDVREIGRTTRGVIGIRLNENDFVVGAVVISDDDNKLLSVSENGLGKQTLAEAYREQSRGGKGVIGMKLTQKTGNLVGVISVDDENLDLMILTASAKMIRVSIKDIRETGRNASGVKLINTADKVMYVNSCPKEEEPENLENSPAQLFE
ncbi:DNA topoisomerase (ATP-hydrolyzing) subunit A [Helicobacter pylori]|uniref:DNA topoisomerase (ATP-hydrolyzing) subunit A n=1 Tax=Helicobacter pylori TaxID=210 RepID=UPI0002BB7D33|nr:DNA topoisomerase (ATP-hydrolyzing) subunit A [Helicobacter pylori]MDO7815188.1 DNA topoisomerase (ATP-hydrolyzing) subunit A [Helicobacter pylori]MDO7819745.1 DNA topoisomerase (ATP-hydrolyzing) subunit A [Helicobacter pylori]MDO7829116.1 DNA topoisomerase (ATP-hydrolyzing) subunit A [Helicobacter pylori]MDO7866096.1 DNA topoisomerase (ATP-hydrolyzing) subunit A [Helicobacter pylori]WQU18153.1 DNA topoisomerase (ATP-hydrolyzing) subunit A [Helicobacter pylori]